MTLVTRSNLDLRRLISPSFVLSEDIVAIDTLCRRTSWLCTVSRDSLRRADGLIEALVFLCSLVRWLCWGCWAWRWDLGRPLLRVLLLTTLPVCRELALDALDALEPMRVDRSLMVRIASRLDAFDNDARALKSTE